MISCTFNGGLGNNLFQLANVYAVAKVNGLDFVIPSTPRRDIIQQMKLKQEPNLELCDLLENKFEYNDRPGLRVYNHIDTGPTAIWSYTPVPKYLGIHVEDNISYNGFFQSDKYFLGLDISKEFILNKHNIDLIKSAYNEVFDKDTISLHCRIGGDRITPHIQQHHRNVSIDYYKSALEKLGYNKEKHNIIVYTDSPDECINFLSGLGAEYKLSTNFNNVVDFTFMSLCTHNIVSNSTFSWWAAYMNQNPNKKVVVPETEWFGPAKSHYNLMDAFPKTWIRI